jgi:hypothetical protein
MPGTTGEWCKVAGVFSSGVLKTSTVKVDRVSEFSVRINISGEEFVKKSGCSFQIAAWSRATFCVSRWQSAQRTNESEPAHRVSSLHFIV